jgi:pyochelin biosynthetic protein PchC
MALTKQRSDTWLRQVPERSAQDNAASLICFPHAGGSARYYFPLMGSLNSMDVTVVQYPGRDDRRFESPIPSIAALADEVTQAILDGPRTRLGLFGHSMGALVAFEVALRLGRVRWSPEHLFVSASPAPSSGRSGRMHQRTDREIVAELRLLGGCSHDAAIEGALMNIVMPSLRNDFQAVETYRPKPGMTLDCPVTALIGSADPRTSSGQARAWSSVTTGRFALRQFAGGHFYINVHAAQVTGIIRCELGAARPAGPLPSAPLPS